MKALTLATISAISVVAIGTVAFAAGPGMGPIGMGPMGMGTMGVGPQAGPMRLFANADTNKDGKLDPAEITAYRDKMFTEANPSGKDGISIQDFEPWFWKQHREMMVRSFQRLDADGDGKITKAEMEAAGDRMLSRLDRNADGTYSLPSRSDRPGWGRGGRQGHHYGPGMMQRWMGQDDGQDGDDAPGSHSGALIAHTSRSTKGRSPRRAAFSMVKRGRIALIGMR